MTDKPATETQEEFKPIPLAKPLNGRTTNCFIGPRPWLQDQLKLIGYQAVTQLDELEAGLGRSPHAIVQCNGKYMRLTAHLDGSVSIADAPGFDLMLPPPMLEEIESKD